MARNVAQTRNPTGIVGLLSTSGHLAVVEGSAKHTDHLIRRCTSCGKMYVAKQYFAQHCEVKRG